MGKAPPASFKQIPLKVKYIILSILNCKNGSNFFVDVVTKPLLAENSKLNK